MSSLALSIALERQYSETSRHYDKMSANAEESGMNPEEISLIKRSQKGDIEAMEALYELYKRPLFTLVYRHTFNFEVAEDLLQDIFLKIFTHLQDIKNEETFKGWVYRLALNVCYSYHRWKKVKLQKTIPLAKVENTIHEKPYETDERMMHRPLDEAIQGLPHKLRSIFLLHDAQGFKHEEIAQVLGCSVGTSKSQLFKARMRIREYLKSKQVL